ncbi:hypothetical protein ABBQ32_002826 [Trebouxia sp. C0010 RCD-2024]
MKASILVVLAAVCALGFTAAQSTTYNLTLTGPANSPPVNDLAVGQAFLIISFNTGSNNITYQLTADNITEVMAGHIHIAPSVGANGSVSIPLYQAPYVNLPGATTTGLLAASALTPSAFVGPYLEVLPDYNNVAVSDVLSQFVQPGLAYAQIHTMQYPDGALKATFDNSSIIDQVVPAVYGAAIVDPFTGYDEGVVPFATTSQLNVTQLNVSTPEANPTASG